MAKIIKYDDETFVVRKFGFEALYFYYLTNQNDNYWWFGKEGVREYIIFHSKEAAQYQWERYKNRNNDKKKKTIRKIVKKWKLK